MLMKANLIMERQSLKLIRKITNGVSIATSYDDKLSEVRNLTILSILDKRAPKTPAKRIPIHE